MKESTEQPPPLPEDEEELDVQGQIEQLMAKFERQAAVFSNWCKANKPRIEQAAADNPQRCDLHDHALEFNLEETFESSFQRADDQFDLEFDQCPLCLEASRLQAKRDKWQRLGLPRKLVDASVKGFTIKADEQGQERRDFKTAISEWVKDPNRPTFLILIGKPGNGKSHMAAALFKHWSQKVRQCAWIRWSDLVRQHRKGYDDSKMAGKALDLAREVPFLVIDDVIPTKGADEFELWTEIIDEREDKGTPTVITTNETEESFFENCLSHGGAIDRVRSDSRILITRFPSYR